MSRCHVHVHVYVYMYMCLAVMYMYMYVCTCICVLLSCSCMCIYMYTVHVQVAVMYTVHVLFVWKFFAVMILRFAFKTEVCEFKVCGLLTQYYHMLQVNKFSGKKFGRYPK